MTLRLVTSDSRDPLLPHDLETEQALLGAILVRGSIDAIGGGLKPEHFFEPIHERIFDCILRSARAGASFSFALIKGEFALDRGMQDVGGVEYLAQCMRAAPGVTDSFIQSYAAIIVRLAAQRAIMAAVADIEACAVDAPSEWSVSDLMLMAEGAIQKASTAFEGSRKTRVYTAADVASDAVKQAMSGEATVSCRFGIKSLDTMVGGLAKGEYALIGGRPGMGKTAVGMQIALNVARQNKAVAFFSLEMPARSIIQRALTAVAYEGGARLAYSDIRKGAFDEKNADALFHAESAFRSLNLWMVEGDGHTPQKLMADAKMLARRAEALGQGLGLIVVDHIQKVAPGRQHNSNKTAEMTEISDALQKMAQAMQCPVLALCQLNRGVEGREDKRPGLADLRESGGLEQDADMVILLYREAYYIQNKEPDQFREPEKHSDWFKRLSAVRFQLEANVAKMRSGEAGTAQLFFDTPSSFVGDM
jgi:replicative DNA helicase